MGSLKTSIMINSLLLDVVDATRYSGPAGGATLSSVMDQQEQQKYSTITQNYFLICVCGSV